MTYSGIHDGCPLHGHSTDHPTGQRIGCLCKQLVASEILTSLRNDGWAVACHNDYRQFGYPCTFWLFTKGNRCAKGEGPDDFTALGKVVDAAEERKR